MTHLTLVLAIIAIALSIVALRRTRRRVSSEIMSAEEIALGTWIEELDERGKVILEQIKLAEQRLAAAAEVSQGECEVAVLVQRLAEAGDTVDDIAKQLGLGKTEVKLMLEMAAARRNEKEG